MFELKLAGIGSAIDAMADRFIPNRLRDELEWHGEWKKVWHFGHVKRPNEKSSVSEGGAPFSQHAAKTA